MLEGEISGSKAISHNRRHGSIVQGPNPVHISPGQVRVLPSLHQETT